jgi:hypothetical protein
VAVALATGEICLSFLKVFQVHYGGQKICQNKLKVQRDGLTPSYLQASSPLVITLEVLEVLLVIPFKY